MRPCRLAQVDAYSHILFYLNSLLGFRRRRLRPGAEKNDYTAERFSDQVYFIEQVSPNCILKRAYEDRKCELRACDWLFSLTS